MDSQEDLAKAREKSGATYGFISDSGLKLIDQFGLRHEGGNPFGGNDIARPAVLLISKDGKLLWSHYADNYRVRPNPDEILTAAKAAMGS